MCIKGLLNFSDYIFGFSVLLNFLVRRQHLECMPLPFVAGDLD